MLMAPLILLLAFFIAPSPASAAWHRAESARFIVYSQKGPGELREMVSRLEDFHILLKALTGSRGEDSPNKLTIYMPDGQVEMNTIFPRIPRGISGLYRASPTATMAIVNQRAGGSAGTQDERSFSTLLHEYAHHFMYQYFPTAYPAWYREGFAEYVSETRFDAQNIEFGRVAQDRGTYLFRSRWIPMERLLYEPDKIQPEEGLMIYAQGWLLNHYMFGEPRRRDALNAYLRAYARGEDMRAAFESASGTTAAAIEAELRRYARSDLGFIRIVRASAARPHNIQISSLPASLERLLLMDAAVQMGLDEEDSPRAFVGRIRADAARHPNDPFAQRVLARAEAMYGDPAVAERILTSLLQAAPNDAELLYLMAVRHSKTGTPEAREIAQQWFARAHRANPNHYPTLYAYALSLAETDERYSENTANILLLAHELAPQVPEISINAAYLLMNREQYDDAAALLAPVANDRHRPRESEAAKALLQRARARQKPEGPAIPERRGRRRS
jgi:hypothetical protein